MRSLRFFIIALLTVFQANSLFAIDLKYIVDCKMRWWSKDPESDNCYQRRAVWTGLDLLNKAIKKCDSENYVENLKSVLREKISKFGPITSENLTVQKTSKQEVRTEFGCEDPEKIPTGDTYYSKNHCKSMQFNWIDGATAPTYLVSGVYELKNHMNVYVKFVVEYSGHSNINEPKNYENYVPIIDTSIKSFITFKVTNFSATVYREISPGVSKGVDEQRKICERIVRETKRKGDPNDLCENPRDQLDKNLTEKISQQLVFAEKNPNCVESEVITRKLPFNPVAAEPDGKRAENIKKWMKIHDKTYKENNSQEQ